MSEQRAEQASSPEWGKDITTRLLTPRDHDQYLQVVSSAWPGLEGLQEHDFAAKAMMGNIVGAVGTDGTILGFSDNVLGAYTDEMLIHMIATRRDAQDKGIGTVLMEYNLGLIRNRILPDKYQQICLTSDPLESRNVRYYLHKTGFICGEYKEDAYRKVSAGGSAVHAGLPQDRFLYRIKPNSAWALGRVLPTELDYASLMYADKLPLHSLDQDPITAMDSSAYANTPVQLVEVPYDLQAIKAANLPLALDWRSMQRKAFQRLFSAGYTAVDQFTEDGRSFIVVTKDFNFDDPLCLINSIQNSL